MSEYDHLDSAEHPAPLPPARRRRERRRLLPPSDNERAALLEKLARRAYPTLEFFLFTLLAGAVIGAGYLLDSQALLFLGILLVPLMSPWVGVVLAAITGALRFFLQTLAGLIIGAALIFVVGLLAGVAARIFMPLTLNQAFVHIHLWWPDLFVLILGAILLPISFARSEEKPILPSAMLAYELYLPLSAAAIGLGSGVPGLWPDGLLVFGIHLALAILVGIISMLIAGFRPHNLAGVALGTTVAIVVILVVLLISGIGTALASRTEIFARGLITTSGLVPGGSEPTPSLVPGSGSDHTPTAALPPTATPKPSITPTLVFPTVEVPTATPSPQPTPVFAKVFTDEGKGVIVRVEPNGELLTTLINGYLVEVQPEVQQSGRAIWVKVKFTLNGEERTGWIIQTLLITATPVADWQPTAAP